MCTTLYTNSNSVIVITSLLLKTTVAIHVKARIFKCIIIIIGIIVCCLLLFYSFIEFVIDCIGIIITIIGILIIIPIEMKFKIIYRIKSKQSTYCGGGNDVIKNTPDGTDINTTNNLGRIFLQLYFNCLQI